MHKTFILTVWVLALGAAAPAKGQISAPAPESPEFYLSGEHYPVLYSGTGLVRGAAHPCTTAWVHTGYSPYAPPAANRNIGRFNPEVFTALVKLSVWGAGDSAAVTQAWFETAYDTAAAPFWNADTSNRFITAAASSRDDFGRWTFLPVRSTARGWSFPLRVLTGGYLRLILSSDLADTCQVSWTLVGER